MAALNHPTNPAASMNESDDNAHFVSLSELHQLQYDLEGIPGDMPALRDAFKRVGIPLPSNSRHAAAIILNYPAVASEILRFVVQQEFLFVKGGGFSGPQGPRTWEFRNAIPDKADVERITELIYQHVKHAGIPQGGFPSIIFLADHNMWISRFNVQGGITIADNISTARNIAMTLAENYGMEVFDPNSIPGFYKEAGIRIKFSTESMRNARGYEASIVLLDKLEMAHALLGEHYSEFKIRPYYEAPTEAADGRAKPSGFVIDMKMPPSHEMNPYIRISKIAEAALLWKPTVREILAAKSRANPFLRALRATWNKVKRSWTCLASTGGPRSTSVSAINCTR